MQHQELLPARGGQGIDDVDFCGFQHGRGDHRALHRAGEGGGDDDADDLLAGLLRRFKLGEEGVGRGLGGLAGLAGEQALPEFLAGQRRGAEALRAEHDLHRHAANVVLFKLLAGQVRGGVGDDTHKLVPFNSRKYERFTN